MKILKLQQVEYNIKIGKQCPYYEPNVKEDCLLELDGEIIGFYIKDVTKYSERLNLLLAVADKEFRSSNVHKSKMDRSNVLAIQQANPGMTRSQARELGTSQMSAILGSIPPKPQFKRNYATISSIHKEPKSQTFIKAMWGACIEAEQIIKKLTPHLYKRQVELFEDVKKEWRFGNMYTSSISNFNISAPFHRDNATFEQADNSMLVYPAWRNVHGVTPIKPIAENGYRNSLIFYPLKAFKGL